MNDTPEPITVPRAYVAKLIRLARELTWRSDLETNQLVGYIEALGELHGIEPAGPESWEGLREEEA